jgi:hypothetical protein
LTRKNIFTFCTSEHTCIHHLPNPRHSTRIRQRPAQQTPLHILAQQIFDHLTPPFDNTPL